ncbi:MAG: hypothetical protein JO170_28930 [Verrucomicrobia bacterium]|nr:hypothetical protein [Verrucomicrobiota bacterium]
MRDSQKSDPRNPRAYPSIWAPLRWAAILTLILAAVIFFTNNLHSLPSHVGEFLMGVLLLPVALVFGLLGGVAGNFLVWLSCIPDWLWFTLMTVDAYFYSLVLMMLIWIFIRLAKRGSGTKRPA